MLNSNKHLSILALTIKCGSLFLNDNHSYALKGQVITHLIQSISHCQPFRDNYSAEYQSTTKC